MSETQIATNLGFCFAAYLDLPDEKQAEISDRLGGQVAVMNDLYWLAQLIHLRDKDHRALHPDRQYEGVFEYEVVEEVAKNYLLMRPDMEGANQLILTALEEFFGEPDDHDLVAALEKRTVWVNLYSTTDGVANLYDSKERADEAAIPGRVGDRAWPLEYHVDRTPPLPARSIALTVNGAVWALPEPLKETPAYKSVYWVLHRGDAQGPIVWNECANDRMALAEGRCYATKEDAQAWAEFDKWCRMGGK